MSFPFTWIYLIYDPFTNLYKIGKSDNPTERHKTLCNPKSYGTIPAAPTDYLLVEAWLASEKVESQMHEKFASCRIRGEWFDLTGFFSIPQKNEYYEVAYRIGELLPRASRYVGEGAHIEEEVEWLRWNYKREKEKTAVLVSMVQRARAFGYLPPALNPAPIKTEKEEMVF